MSWVLASSVTVSRFLDGTLVSEAEGGGLIGQWVNLLVDRIETFSIRVTVQPDYMLC